MIVGGQWLRAAWAPDSAFLTLAQRRRACRDTAALITVNWGSVIETHDPSTLESHARA